MRKIPLPQVTGEFLATPEGHWCRQAVRILHRWMRARNLTLADLTPVHIEQFWAEQECRLAKYTVQARRSGINKYLQWLGNKELLRFTVPPTPFSHMRSVLPDPARRFLKQRGNRGSAPAVRNFHDWLRRNGIELSDLTPSGFAEFLRRPILTLISKSTQKSLYHSLKPYLLWLHGKGFISFVPENGARKFFALPNGAYAFIDTLRPVLKASTCRGYVVDLRDLHSWLDAQALSVNSFDRRTAERWLMSLANRGLAPSTRNIRIVNVRSYLLWLAERGDFDGDPFHLLCSADMPKIPSYLPRPFPPDIDRELQRRFRQAGNIYGDALFLMRRTGMRIGELVRLERRCFDEDVNGNIFIKVPLGKLNNERLVPIDDETRQVAERLYRGCPPNAPFLIEPNARRVTITERLRDTLRNAAKGLDIPGSVVSHRLRHTYATELLNAGMSLICLMKLLGHRSIRMTMRYASITQETVVKEYFSAMTKISHQYELPDQAVVFSIDESDPDRMLLDVISYLRKNTTDAAASQRLVTRIHKIRYDIAHLKNKPSIH